MLWTRESTPTNPQEQEEYFQNLPEDKLFLGVYDADEWQVGTAGLTDIDHMNQTAEFSLLIGEEFRGKGYGRKALGSLVSYAFDVLNLRTVWGETFCYPREAMWFLKKYNTRLINPRQVYSDLNGDYFINPAAKVFDYMGFKKEGFLRDRYYKYGFTVSSVVCSVRRKEWGHLNLPL